MLSSDVGGRPETSHGVVTCHRVTLKKRITEGTTAEEQVVRIRDTTTANEPVVRSTKLSNKGTRTARDDHEDLER